uniref:Uncharacterized protein n=1 Tax=Lotus japonicus TaxID=34305 RepID=I3S393_LOTJA|nr:unknown [Lotus japonicus]
MILIIQNTELRLAKKKNTELRYTCYLVTSVYTDTYHSKQL